LVEMSLRSISTNGRRRPPVVRVRFTPKAGEATHRPTVG